MKVESYDIFLDVDLSKLRFDGKVKIRLESETDVKLDAVDLEVSQIRANGSPVKYQMSGEDLSVKTGKFSGTLDIDYRGTISEKLVGFYKAAYDGGYIASTQFEAASARRMLPSIDHPAHKAEFKLTVKTDKDLDVISNTPSVSSKIEGSKKVVEFQKTPRMSTYLLYLGVGKFEEVKEKHDGVEYAVATVPGKSSGAKFPPNFNPNDIHRVPNDSSLWGHITFTFSGCNDGTVSWPLKNNLSSPAGVLSLRMVRWGLVVVLSTNPDVARVHGSHTLPIPSPSPSA